MLKRLTLLIPLFLGLIVVQQAIAAQAPQPVRQASVMHPTFALLDATGKNVLETQAPLSTEKTCGTCHDTAYITTHSFHADLGYTDKTPENARPWEIGSGLYGQWNPLTYRYLSSGGDGLKDLTPDTWLQFNAARVAGGGMARALGLEFNCFLCHFTNPNNAERTTAIQRNNIAWANTATLLGTGIVVANNDGTYAYDPSAFDAAGNLQRAFITLQDPSNANCAQCHGVVHTTPDPLTLTGRDLTQWQTATTGQVVSPQKIAQSGMNLAAKATLTRPWDIHAERGLQCVDCHYALNNPILAQTNAKVQPDHILFDPRRLDISEYLQRPSHQFARGQSAQSTVAPDLKGTLDFKGTMRRCESCHEATQTHSWLPYTEQHLSAVACESCHIPKLYAPAVQSVDWTVLTLAGEPVTTWRGVEGNSGTLNDLITGYTPVLLQRTGIEGQTRLAPYNLVTAWYWLYASPNGPRPVRLADLQAAYFSNGQYRPEILQALDTDGDKTLAQAELRLDTAEKQNTVIKQLENLGLPNPHLASEIQPYSINHDVTRSDDAIRDCTVCHGADSRVTGAIVLSTGGPTGLTPAFVKTTNTSANGTITTVDNTLVFTPAPPGLYVFGHNRVAWVDWVGVGLVLSVLVGVTAHGGLRYYAALKRKGHVAPAIKRVYMYAVYERFWHWLQTFAIFILITTGLIIHRPDLFGIFSFPYVVVIHNVLAVILVLNAALSLFYHLVSGEIQQYIPRPYGFFDQAIVQAKYYLQGIFKGTAHPFAKTPQHKLNPLQQLTYFGILNVLLPLQVLTGALMWGVQSFPQISAWFGGLPFLAPFHSLVAWAFAAFIIAHVYLTTTGHTPLAGIQAMMLGWDEVDAPPAPEPVATPQPAGD